MTTVQVINQVTTTIVDGDTVTVQVAPETTEVTVQPGVTAFVGLSDAPHSYIGHAGEAVIVNDDEDGLAFGTVVGGGAVDSVNGQTGVVVLDAADVGALDQATADTLYAALSHTHTFASLTSKPTTLAGYGITDAQPIDSDLTAIAALTTTSYGRALLELADAAALRTAAGLGTAATADTGTGPSNVPTVTQADGLYARLAAVNTFTKANTVAVDSDATALTLKGTSGQTANLEEYRNSANALLGFRDAHGRIGIGSEAVTERVGDEGNNIYGEHDLISAVHTFTTSDTYGEQIGAYVSATLHDTTGVGVAASSYLYGVSGNAIIAAGSTASPDYLYGLSYAAYNHSALDLEQIIGLAVTPGAYGTGNTTTMLGVEVQLQPAGSTANVGTGVGVQIETPYRPGGATFDILYGLLVQNHAASGGTLTRAILTEGGTVEHQAGSASVVPLMLKLAATPSADALDIFASDGTTKLAYFDSTGKLNGPAALTGTPTAPTASGGTNTTQIATTAFVTSAVAGAGGVSDGDKGDITVSASGATWTIDTAAVSYAKIQDVSATDKLLGRVSSGSGDIEEVTFTDFAQSLVDDADASTARTTLGAQTAIAEGRPKLSSTVYLTLPGVNIGDGSLATFVPGNNRIHYMPIVVYNTITVDLVFEVTTNGGSGETARVGIYNADTDWQPTSRVYGSNTVAIDSGAGAAPVVKTVAAAQQLTPGRYLLAIRTDGATAAFRRVVGSYPGGPALLTTMGTTGIISEMRKNSSAYATFPDPGTAWDTVNNANTGMIYCVFCQVTTP